ncbi:phosphorylase superfamily protein [Colletotrichum incanum]|uniref:Phosphorylase superfamily protein n=1 Tax=Colletotrichum incanum TaxID=1573173 RepID=A0A162NPJ1_COLIC|nr:phosphorylase superfamily protein [Colletotrichum incanum]OHX00890.1 phosphorylase superfamily protein [Colletotrichum incanum]
MCSPSRPAGRNNFKIAIICALPLEFDAVTLLFDEFWDEDGDPYGRAPGDMNTYTTGRIGNQNVVLVVPPSIGNNSAASAAASFRSSYGCLKLALLFGICGGVPKIGSDEVLLGDVIISKTLVQYNFGRQFLETFVTKNTIDDSLGRANRDIRGLITNLETELGRERLQDKAAKHLQHLQNAAARKRRRANYHPPGAAEDKLFAPDYAHQHRKSCDLCAAEGGSFCEAAARTSCVDFGCDGSKLISRKRLQAEEGTTGDDTRFPQIFIGRIASGDMVMKSGKHRDQIAAAHNVIAFEMEGAGAWDEVPCVVVKGVCDYADSHKNKDSQDYAAATAASVARAMLEWYVVGDGSVTRALGAGQERGSGGGRTISNNSFGNNIQIMQGDLHGNLGFGQF